MNASPPHQFAHVTCALLGWLLLLAPLNPSGASAGTLPGIIEFEILPPEPTEADDISIHIFGEWPDSCIPMEPMASITDGEVLIATVSFGEICVLTVTPWSETVPTGSLSAGDYGVVVTNAFLPGPQQKIGRTVFTVPEPSSWLLGLAGLAAAGSMARRKDRYARARHGVYGATSALVQGPVPPRRASAREAGLGSPRTAGEPRRR